MDFTDFTTHGDKLVMKSAILLNDAKVKLDAGSITKDQFNEIADDILQIAEVVNITNSANQKIIVENAISILKQIVKAILK